MGVRSVRRSKPRYVAEVHAHILSFPRHLRRKKRVLPGVRDEATAEGEAESERQHTNREKASRNRALELLASGRTLGGIDGLESPAPFASASGLVRKEQKSALAPHHCVRNATKGDDTGPRNATTPTKIIKSLQSRDGVGGDCNRLEGVQHDRQVLPSPLSQPGKAVNGLGLVYDAVAVVTDSDVRRTYSILQNQGGGDMKCDAEMKTDREHSPVQQRAVGCNTKPTMACPSRGSATLTAHAAEATWDNCDIEATALPMSATSRTVSLLHHGTPTMPKTAPILADKSTASIRSMDAAQVAGTLSVEKLIRTTPEASFGADQERELTEGLGTWAGEVVTVGQLLDTHRLQVAEDLQGVVHGEHRVRQHLERDVGATVQTLPLSFLKHHGYLGEAQSQGLERARRAVDRQAARLRARAWQR